MPAKNYYLSAPLKVVIDNTPHSLSQVSIAQTYNVVYYLFAKAFDADSGISYVQYWDGDRACIFLSKNYILFFFILFISILVTDKGLLVY